MIFTRILSLAALLNCSAIVLADEVNNTSHSTAIEVLQFQDVSGFVRANYFSSSKSMDDVTDFLGVTAQIKALPQLNDTIDGKLEARITNSAPDYRGISTNRLLEGYATVHFTKADLRIGKQIVAWGRADGINPTDNLTPRDFVVMLPFVEDQRFGTTALKLDTYLSAEHTLTIFTTPFFEPSKVPLPSGSSIIETRPTNSLSNSQFGLRFNKVGGETDWSVSYYRGFSLLPDARVIVNGTVEPTLELHYDRISVFGADFARNYDRYGFRGEFAYVDTKDVGGTDPGIKNPFLFWVAGIDRTFFDNLNINLQFFERYVLNYHNPEYITDPTERNVAIHNAIADGQQDKISNGISFRVGTKWLNDALEAEILAVLNLTRKDGMIRPLISYAFSDHWKGAVGGEFYDGEGNTQFGILKQNQGVFVEFRYGL